MRSILILKPHFSSKKHSRLNAHLAVGIFSGSEVVLLLTQHRRFEMVFTEANMLAIGRCTQSRCRWLILRPFRFSCWPSFMIRFPLPVDGLRILTTLLAGDPPHDMMVLYAVVVQQTSDCAVCPAVGKCSSRSSCRGQRDQSPATPV